MLQKKFSTAGADIVVLCTLRSNKQRNMKIKKQYTLSDQNAQRLHLVGRLYERDPDDLLGEAVAAMWAASFGSYNQATRREMIENLIQEEEVES